MVKKNTPNQSIDKLLAIFETMAFVARPMRLIDIAEKSQVPSSTAMRILNTLIDTGYAKQSEETNLYSLSHKILWLGDNIRECNPATQTLRPYLKEIVYRTSVSCGLAICENRNIVFIDEIISQKHVIRVHHDLGKPFPLHNTACGKVFLSTQSEEALKQYFLQEKIAPTTPKTIIKLKELYDAVRMVQEKGYAIEDEERMPGLRCLGFPVTDSKGEIQAAISLSGTTNQITSSNQEMLVSVVQSIIAKR